MDDLDEKSLLLGLLLGLLVGGAVGFALGFALSLRQSEATTSQSLIRDSSGRIVEVKREK